MRARSFSGWAQLAAARGSPMQHCIWAQAYSETYGASLLQHVIVAGGEATPTALAALVEIPGLFGRLETLGVRHLGEPMDLLARNRAAMQELAEKLALQARPLLFRRLPANSPALPALREAFRHRGILRIAPATPYPCLELGASWRVPENNFNAGRRSDFRRARRGAEKLGEVTFEVRSPTLLEAPALLDELWRVEAAGWKGEGGSALAVDSRRGEFFRRYSLAAARQGLLRLAFMRIGGRAVAAQLDIECASRLWLLKIGYDEAYARCSPGQQLMLEVIRHAAARALDSIEFLGRAEPWTELWTKNVRECVTVHGYPFTIPGVAALAADGVAYLLKK